VIAQTRNSRERRRSRENCGMAAVSQGLIEFANHFRQPPAPGIEIIETPRYRITLQPDYPIPGPNSVSWVRCSAREAGEVIAEVHAIVALRRLPIMWTLDPETSPADFGDHLAAHGILPEPHSPEVKVMVLDVEAPLDAPAVPGLELHDALADAETFRLADAVNAEAFRDRERDPLSQERRRVNQLEAGNRRVLLATVDGEPAGSAGMSQPSRHRRRAFGSKCTGAPWMSGAFGSNELVNSLGWRRGWDATCLRRESCIRSARAQEETVFSG
jgi:hypothetical protein